MLVVTIGIVLGVLYQLNSAFKAFAANYFGDYLACLLETGELPSIGGTPDASGECNALFKPFSLAEGRPLIPTAGAGAGAGSSSGKTQGADGDSGNSQQQGKASYTKIARSSGASSGGGSSGSSGGGGRSRSGGGGGGKEEKAYTGSEATSIPSSALGRKGGGGDGQGQFLDYGYTSDTKKQQEQGQSVSVPIAKKGDTIQKKGDIIINRKPARTNTDTGDSEWTFGDYLKFLIIAAILIVFLYVVGQQIFQTGQSSD